MKEFTKMIGLRNLIVLIFAEIVIKYFFLAQFTPFGSLGVLDFSLLSFASLCIAASGHVLNYQWNYPKKMTRPKAENIFLVLNVIGIGIGFYLAFTSGYPIFTGIFIIVSGLIYSYNNSFRKQTVVGNLVLSFLAVSPVFLIAFYDIIPVIYSENKGALLELLTILAYYAVFVFFITWIYRMAKDQYRLKNDHNQKINTLPIALGRRRAKNVLMSVLALVIIGFFYYAAQNFYFNNKVLIFNLIVIGSPLLIGFVWVLQAKKSLDYKRLLRLFYNLIVLSIISLFFYQFALIQ